MSKVWVGLVIVVWCIASDALAAPIALSGRWLDASGGPEKIADFEDLDKAQLREVQGPALTGGSYWYLSDLSIEVDARYVIDFKNSSTIGRFEHALFDARGREVARAAGGIQSTALNPYFMRHARELDLPAGRYRLASRLESPFFLGQPEPFVDTASHYQQDVKLSNAIALLCLGILIGLGLYYAALSVVRRRVADGAYALFIMGNVLYNGTALLLWPDVFGMHWFYLVSAPILFSNCAYVVFVMALLEIRPSTHPILYRSGLAILCAFGVCIAVAALRPTWSLELDRYGVGTFVSFGLVAATIRSREGNATARVYLVAIAAFFVLGILAISLNRVNAFTIYIEHLGLLAVVVEVVLLALVLAHQFSLLSKEKDSALAAAEVGARLKATLDALPDNVFELDGTGRITAFHTSSDDAFITPERPLLGRKLAEALSPTADVGIEDALHEARTKGSHRGATFSWPTPRGARWFELSIARKDAQEPAQPQFVAITREITELKHAAAQRLEHERKLQHAQKLESLGVLAGGIAHDFNNLLTGIIGHSELAKQQMPPESTGYTSISSAIQGAKRAAELATQMLAYSGKGRFAIESVDLSTLTQELTRLLQVSVPKTCSLRYEFAANLPSVEADATQLRQVVMNLIINASEAVGSAQGSVTVRTGVRYCDQAYLSSAIHAEGLSEGSYVFLEVSDTGCGMSASTQAKLFDPFFTTKFTGRGLGLSVVLGIVRGHRGAIRVTSAENVGATFTVLLPASIRRLQAPATAIAEPMPWVGEGTVLVVDDEESVRSMASSMLEMLGFNVLIATDGREGVETFVREADRISLVLLDMTMPRLGGIEAMREMVSIRSSVRVVLSSGYDEQTATGKAAGGAWAGFLQKPYGYAELQRVVRRALAANSSPS